MPLKVPPSVLKDKKALEDYVHKHIFPKVSQAQREYLAQFFTVLFSDGFESGDFSAWTGTVVSSGCSTTVESANPHHGSYNQKSTVTGSVANEWACASKNIGTSYSHAFVRSYVKYASYSGLDASEIIPCVSFWVNQADTNTARAGLGKDASGNVRWAIRYYHAGSFYNAYGSSTPTTGVWYSVELEVQVGTSGYVKLYVNGNLEISVTAINNSARQFAHVHVGIDQISGTVAATVYTDCVVVADTYIGIEAAPTLVEVTDSIGLADTVLRNKTLAVTDSIGLADTPLKSWTPTVIDAVSLLESVLCSKTLRVFDSVSLSDLVTVLLPGVVQVFDSVGLVDAVKIDKSLLVQDVLALLDEVKRNKQLMITDVVSAIEAVMVGKMFAVSDSVHATDAVLRNKLLPILDAVGLFDVILCNKQLIVSDVAHVTETVLRNKVITLLDSVGLADVVKVNKVLIVSDEVALAELVSVIPQLSHAPFYLPIRLKVRKT
jgi:hypothetical protein